MAKPWIKNGRRVLTPSGRIAICEEVFLPCNPCISTVPTAFDVVISGMTSPCNVYNGTHTLSYFDTFIFTIGASTFVLYRYTASAPGDNFYLLSIGCTTTTGGVTQRTIVMNITNNIDSGSPLVTWQRTYSATPAISCHTLSSESIPRAGGLICLLDTTPVLVTAL